MQNIYYSKKQLEDDFVERRKSNEQTSVMPIYEWDMGTPVSEVERSITELTAKQYISGFQRNVSHFKISNGTPQTFSSSKDIISYYYPLIEQLSIRFGLCIRNHFSPLYNDYDDISHLNNYKITNFKYANDVLLANASNHKILYTTKKSKDALGIKSEAIQSLYVSLYNNREQYLELLGNSDCPYCNCAEATTIDHYLPKTAFPALCINPWNLIPACSKCNSLKKTYFGSDNTNPPFFNPVLDDFESAESGESWLTVDIDSSTCKPGNLPNFIFRTVRPSYLSDESYKTLVFSFNKLQLSHRYNRCLVRDLNNKAKILASLTTESSISSYFRQLVRVNSYPIHNCWQSVSYEAIANSTKIQKSLIEYFSSKNPSIPVFYLNGPAPNIPMQELLIKNFVDNFNLPPEIFDSTISCLRYSDKSIYILTLTSSPDSFDNYIVTDNIFDTILDFDSAYTVFIRDDNNCRCIGKYLPVPVKNTASYSIFKIAK